MTSSSSSSSALAIAQSTPAFSARFAYRAAASGAQLLAGLRVTSVAAVYLELVRPSVIRWLEPVAE